MLIRFSTKNYLSFREKQTLDLMAIREIRDRQEENTIPLADGDALLRTVALYGANASGKSNLFSALAFCTRFMLGSFGNRNATSDIQTVPFLYDNKSRKAPSGFELEFTAGGRWYKYGFSANQKVVETEWLFAREGQEAAMVPRFGRKRVKGEDRIEVHPSFSGADDTIVGKTRENALFLSTCAGLDVKEALTILREIAGWSFQSGGTNKAAMTARMLAEGQNKHAIVRFVHMADPSIDDLGVERVEHDTDQVGADGEVVRTVGFRVEMGHKLASGKKRTLPFGALGSLGTQKAFALAGPVFRALDQGTVLFIDELESSLHPMLTREIIKLFNNPTTNPQNAQLVFNTHDTHLLDCEVYNPALGRKEQLLRRDQVYFAERTGEYSSRLYSLADFTPETDEHLPEGDSPETEYLTGRYGAIPFIGNFSFGNEKKGDSGK